MQGKLCHPGNECESPPEFVFIAFDGKIVQEHGNKKVSENDIIDILFIPQNGLQCLQTLHTYPLPKLCMLIKRSFTKLKRSLQLCFTSVSKETR